MELFTSDNPWIRQDNRRNRVYNTVTPGSHNAKCLASLPPDLIAGKSVLDLGCCVGHAGWWSLSNGAQFYCGVETQKEYFDTARQLFADHFDPSSYELVQDDLIRFLETDPRDFDLVLLAGITYGFIDPLYLFRLSARRALMVVVDTAYPLTMTQGRKSSAYMEFLTEQRMVLARDDVLHASGPGSRISPKGLDLVMSNLGFDAQEVTVAPITDCEDVYNFARPNSVGALFPLKYVRRYVRSGKRVLSVSEEVVAGSVSRMIEMYNPAGADSHPPKIIEEALPIRVKASADALKTGTPDGDPADSRAKLG